MRKSYKELESGRNFKLALLIVIGINTGLRISDLLKLRGSDISREKMIIIEQKTKKERKIEINDNIKIAFAIYKERMGHHYKSEDYLFISNKGGIYSIRQINRLLQRFFESTGKKISSHSLRKTFGRRVWVINEYSDKSLILLSHLFNHSSVQITRIYLGIREEEIKDVYLNL
jgi:integrase